MIEAMGTLIMTELVYEITGSIAALGVLRMALFMIFGFDIFVLHVHHSDPSDD